MRKPSIIYKHYIPHAIAGKMSMASPLCAFAAATDYETIQISESNTGAQTFTYADAQNPVISDDGNYIVFNSSGYDLVSGDNNFVSDVFVFDKTGGTIKRISVNSPGEEGNDSSDFPAAISANGQYIAFASNATNLDSANPGSGLFIHDTQDTSGNPTKRISDAAPFQLDISADGSWVVYAHFDGIWRSSRDGSSSIRVDVNDAAEGGDDDSYNPSISANGNIVVFSSNATNLAAGASNTYSDIYIRDILAGTTTQIMGGALVEGVWETGHSPNGNSKLISGAISDDGLYIAFTSDATNLVDSDTNSANDVFVYYSVTAHVSRIMNNDGTEPTGGTFGKSNNASISANGNFVSFSSKLDYEVIGESLTSPNIFLSDLSSGTQIVSRSKTGTSNSYGDQPRVSGAGENVVFQSASDNLVYFDNNNKTDIFLHTVGDTTAQRINVTPLGEQATTTAINQLSDVNYNATGGRKISADGRYIVFDSDAINLVDNDNNSVSDVFLYDRLTGLIERISETAAGEEGNSGSYAPSISANGRYITFHTGSSNLSGSSGILVYDMINNTFNNIGSGPPNNAPYTSSDGHYTAYLTYNNNQDISLYNSVTMLTTPVALGDGTVANGPSFSPSVSDDGRYVVFTSDADNLVANDTNALKDIFVFDTQTQNIQRINTAANGTEANGKSSDNPMISADGQYVVYESDASNLVDSDTNNTSDIFLYKMSDHSTQRINLGALDAQANNYSSFPYLSSNGNYISYASLATNLTDDVSNGQAQIYVYNIIEGTTRLSSISRLGDVGNLYSTSSAVSDYGSIVAYNSFSNNLIPNDTNGPSSKDIFVTSVADLACLDTALTISDTQYTADTVNESKISISTSGSVVVPSGINVTYNAPVITLSAGFHAQAGSNFTATTNSASCSAGRPVSRQVSSELLQEAELTSSSFELEPQAIAQNEIPSVQQQLINTLNTIPFYSENQISLKFNTAGLLTFYHNDHIIYAAKPASDAQQAAQDVGLYINDYPANFVFSDNEGLSSIDFYGTPLYPDLLKTYKLKFETSEQKAQITIDNMVYEGYFDYSVKHVEKTGKDIPVFSITPSRIQITWPTGEQQTMLILE